MAHEAQPPDSAPPRGWLPPVPPGSSPPPVPPAPAPAPTAWGQPTPPPAGPAPPGWGPPWATSLYYSYREPGLIQPLLDRFTAETGIKTNVLFAGDGLIERVAAEGELSPADVIITVDIGSRAPASGSACSPSWPRSAPPPGGCWRSSTGTRSTRARRCRTTRRRPSSAPPDGRLRAKSRGSGPAGTSASLAPGWPIRS